MKNDEIDLKKGRLKRRKSLVFFIFLAFFSLALIHLLSSSFLEDGGGSALTFFSSSTSAYKLNRPVSGFPPILPVIPTAVLINIVVLGAVVYHGRMFGVRGFESEVDVHGSGFKKWFSNVLALNRRSLKRGGFRGLKNRESVLQRGEFKESELNESVFEGSGLDSGVWRFKDSGGKFLGSGFGDDYWSLNKSNMFLKYDEVNKGLLKKRDVLLGKRKSGGFEHLSELGEVAYESFIEANELTILGKLNVPIYLRYAFTSEGSSLLLDNKLGEFVEGYSNYFLSYPLPFVFGAAGSIIGTMALGLGSKGLLVREGYEIGTYVGEMAGTFLQNSYFHSKQKKEDFEDYLKQISYSNKKKNVLYDLGYGRGFNALTKFDATVTLPSDIKSSHEEMGFYDGVEDKRRILYKGFVERRKSKSAFYRKVAGSIDSNYFYFSSRFLKKEARKFKVSRRIREKFEKVIRIKKA